MKIQDIFKFKSLWQTEELEPALAYNQIAEFYDDQQDSLLHSLDDEIFKNLISAINIDDKIIADIGCGTGRHWNYLIAKKPAELIGFDVSQKMLDQLRSKHFSARLYMQKNDKLVQLTDKSCDIIISTLTIGYIKNIEAAFAEWDRVLNSNGEIILTDYHPELLRKGGNRKFENGQKSISPKNYIHTIEKIKNIAAENGFEIVQFQDKNIDENIKHFYENKNALSVYNKFFGTPIIYGLHLKKANVSS